jgi:hypothetical protein
MVMADLGMWRVDGDAPRRVARSGVGLERCLEDWIANDSSLLADGLTVVGRQVWLEGGPLDLLAIDRQRDRWVVIELKRERLYRDALAQALDYASSLAGMDGNVLKERLRPGLATLGDHDELERLVRSQLDGEGEGRDVAVVLAGVGVDAGLERIVAHLGGYGMPITIVSFDAFQPAGGPLLLLREVAEEGTFAPRGRRTVDEIRARADEAGVAEPFDRFLDMAQRAGLAVQPHRVGVRIAPAGRRNRYLMYARPEVGGIALSAGPAEFAEFFPPLTEDAATAALGPYEPEPRLAGAELDARLDQIETFLATLPRPGDDG